MIQTLLYIAMNVCVNIAPKENHFFFFLVDGNDQASGIVSTPQNGGEDASQIVGGSPA